MIDQEFQPFLDRIQRLAENAPRAWGKMTPAQMLVHCRIQLETALGRYHARQMDSWMTRTIMKPLLFLLPWPKGNAKTHPDFDVVGRAMPVRSFAEERSALEAALREFAEVFAAMPSHPLLGPFSREEWRRMHRLHLDHHLRQFGG